MFKKEKFVISESIDFNLLKARVSDLEIEIEKLKTHINSLRGFVNRRIAEQLPKINEKETSKNIDGLDELRSI